MNTQKHRISSVTSNTVHFFYYLQKIKSNVELTDRIVLFSAGLIKTLITGIKTQTIESDPTVRLTPTPHEVSHRPLTVDPGPATFSPNIVPSSPPGYQVSLKIQRFRIKNYFLFDYLSCKEYQKRSDVIVLLQKYK